MRKARRNCLFAGSLLLVALAATPLAACSATGQDTAVAVVTQYLQAEKDNDYDAWVGTLIQDKQEAFTRESNGEFGVISLDIGQVSVSPQETQRMKDRYTGSDLAKRYGWSDVYIAENMIVVTAQYKVDYDNAKVPNNDGDITQDFILVRDGPDLPWLIWDTGSPSG